MKLDSLVLDLIVKYDLTTYNSLMRTSKVINSKLKINNNLRNLVVDFYKNKLREFIDDQLHRALAINDDRIITHVEPNDIYRDTNYVVKFYGDEDWENYSYYEKKSTKSAVRNLFSLQEKYKNLCNATKTQVFGEEYITDKTTDIMENFLSTRSYSFFNSKMTSLLHYWFVFLLGSYIPVLFSVCSERYSKNFSMYVTSLIADIRFVDVFLIHLISSILLATLVVMFQN